MLLSEWTWKDVPNQSNQALAQEAHKPKPPLCCPSIRREPLFETREGGRGDAPRQTDPLELFNAFRLVNANNIPVKIRLNDCPHFSRIDLTVSLSNPSLI